MPPLITAFSGPGLVVHGDGRVIQFDDEKRTYDSPPSYVIVTVSPTAVAEFAAEAEATNLINERTDFGTPEVTDLPTTAVWLRGASGEQTVSVYAFGDPFDHDVSVLQARNRRRLAALIDRAYALPGDSTSYPYQPDQVRVLELDPRYGQQTGAPAWPGPDPDTFLNPSERRYPGIACGTLTGEQAPSTPQPGTTEVRGGRSGIASAY